MPAVHIATARGCETDFDIEKLIQASAVMSSLMSIAPQTATIAETGEVVNVDDVTLNTILAVKAGEIIPVDGIVVEGTCEADEKTLTGESFPVAKQKDSAVWAGTVNVNGIYLSSISFALCHSNGCLSADMISYIRLCQYTNNCPRRGLCSSKTGEASRRGSEQ